MHLKYNLTQLEASDVRWKRLQDAHLFITGGSGLFGCWFIAALLNANQRLGTNIQATVLTRNPQPFLENFLAQDGVEHIHPLQGDVTNFTPPATKFTHVLHMATTSAHETFAGEDSLAKFHLLTTGTERVLALAAKSGVKKVLFTSSGVAYGALQDEPVVESFQGAPNTLDAVSGLAQGKRAAEFLCSYYAQKYGFEATIARCFAFVGEGLPLNIHYAIGNFIHDALNAEKITVKGDGSPMRSFLYLGDLVHWLLATLVDGRHNTVYNVGSDRAVSILALAHLVKDLLAPDTPVIVQGNACYAVGNFNRNWYVPDITRAKSELGVDVWTSLEQAILHTAQ